MNRSLSRIGFLVAALLPASLAPTAAAVRTSAAARNGYKGTFGYSVPRSAGTRRLDITVPLGAVRLGPVLTGAPAPAAGARMDFFPAPGPVLAAPMIAIPAAQSAVPAPLSWSGSVLPALAPAAPAAEPVRDSASGRTGITGFMRRLGRLFDGSRAPAPEPVFAEHLLTPAHTPLPPVALPPAWDKTERVRAQAEVEFKRTGREDWGAQHTAPTLDLSVQTVRQILPKSEGLAELGGALAASWQTPAGAKNARAMGKKIFYIDAPGRLCVHDPATAETKVYASPSGAADRFILKDETYLYVVSGKALQGWNLATNKVDTLSPKDFDAGSIGAMVWGERWHTETDHTFYFPGGQINALYWQLTKHSGGLVLAKGGEPVRGVVPAGKGLYYRVQDGQTTVWNRVASVSDVEEYGTIPFSVVSMAHVPMRGALLMAAREGLVYWPMGEDRYRFFPMPGLAEAADRGELAVQIDGGRILLSAGREVYELDPEALRRDILPSEKARQWSEANPMYVRDGALHIGDFSFPIGVQAPAAQPWYLRLWNRLRRTPAPQAVLDLGISPKDWQALNLPTNKRLIYDTLKAFTMSQHVLYIGETGGGKTWVAEKIAQLIGNELWMVSMNEYTRNKDLIARETFGEEGKNRTGLSMSTVLRWMTEGGVLLLDEMHKPLEGIAVLNNILQNGEYRLPDGRIIKYDKTRSFVIGTMNPVKPPYKGEPPSGELSSRFGMTLEVKYLPAEEESALLRIFYPSVVRALVDKLVAIANDLRKVYPDILPLPIAPRTLMHIMEHVQKYPKDSVVDIFTKTYNPASIVEDPAISAAIDKVLKDHDLSGEGPAAKPQTPARRDVRDKTAPAPAASAAGGSGKISGMGPKSRGHMDYSDPRAGRTGPLALPGPMPFNSGMIPPPMTFTSPRGDAPASGQSLVEGWAKSLEQFARMLARYTGLRLVPFYILEKHGESVNTTARRWRTVLGLEEIHYLPEEMDKANRDVALGRTAHEVWHLLFSRPEIIFDHPELIRNMAFQALWWAVEDPRVNNAGLVRHPGARPWVDAAYHKDYHIRHLDMERQAWNSGIPLHLQFNYALIYQWWAGTPDPRVTDSRVRAALRLAGPAIKRAIRMTDAGQAFIIIRDQIWPIYKQLIEEQVQDEVNKEEQEQDQAQQEKKAGAGQPQPGQAGGQKSSGGGGGQSSDSPDQQDGEAGDSAASGQQQKPRTPEQAQRDEKSAQAEQEARDRLEQKSKEYRDQHAPKMSDSPEAMSKSEQDKARDEMEKQRDKIDEAQKSEDQKPADKAQDQGEAKKGQQKAAQKGQPGQSGAPGQGAGSGGKSGKAADPAKQRQQQAKQKGRLNKADQEKAASSEDRSLYQEYLQRVQRSIPLMRQQLLHALHQKMRRRVLQGRDTGDLDPDALPRIPKGDKDVFMEEFSPNKVLYRISLLIDTSGSMSGAKKERAMEGAVMMMEALGKIPGVLFEIVKFDNNPAVLKPFNKKLSPNMKAGILASIKDGTGSTDAFTALQEAIQRVRLGRGDKMIIMVNDGDPDYNFDRDDYRKMIGEAKDVEIHGIGLGSEAQLVLDLFPPGRGWWLKDAADFAKSLRNILKKKLLGGRN
ncbi:MAG: AAA family ATPase [Elusimicrobiota bacterium]|jgi:hypothetical protein